MLAPRGGGGGEAWGWGSVRPRNQAVRAEECGVRFGAEPKGLAWLRSGNHLLAQYFLLATSHNRPEPLPYVCPLAFVKLLLDGKTRKKEKYPGVPFGPESES